MNLEEDKKFIYCESCGKRLIAVLPDGSGEFKFGKQGATKRPPVVMIIWGIIRLKCLSRTCEHEQTIAFFPKKSESPVKII